MKANINASIKLFMSGRRESAFLQIAEVILPERKRSDRQKKRLRLVLAGVRMAWDDPDFDIRSALQTFAMEVADIKAGRQPLATR